MNLKSLKSVSEAHLINLKTLGNTYGASASTFPPLGEACWNFKKIAREFKIFSCVLSVRT